MGLVYAELTLLNSEEMNAARRGKIAPSAVKQITVNAQVETGAYMLCINENIRQQLDVIKISDSTAKLADESVIRVDVVGPVEVHFQNRVTVVNAAVLPGNAEVLLGAIPIEDMDVVISPKSGTLEVNPASPNYAKKKLK